MENIVKQKMCFHYRVFAGVYLVFMCLFLDFIDGCCDNMPVHIPHLWSWVWCVHRILTFSPWACPGSQKVKAVVRPGRGALSPPYRSSIWKTKKTRNKQSEWFKNCTGIRPLQTYLHSLNFFFVRVQVEISKLWPGHSILSLSGKNLFFGLFVVVFLWCVFTFTSVCGLTKQHEFTLKYTFFFLL